MTFAFRDGSENPFITLAGWTYRAATFETVAEIFREACMMMTVDVPCESVKTRRNLWCSTFLPADFGRPPFFSQCDDDRIASGKIANVGRNSDWVMASFFRLCLPLVRTRHRVSHFEFNSEIPSATHI